MVIQERGHQNVRVEAILQVGYHVGKQRAAAGPGVIRQNLGQAAGAARAGEPEKAVYAAGIVVGNQRGAFPGFADNVAVRLDLFGFRIQPGEEFYVLVQLTGVVAGNGVQTEAVNAHVQPIGHDLATFLPHLGVVQVQVRHGGNKARFVIAAADGIIAALRGVAEIVIFAVGRIRTGNRRLEPGMVTGGMVHNQIQNHPDAKRMRPFQKGLEIIQRAVGGIDAVIIRHIVFVIGRRGHNRHQPNAGESHIADIGQLFGGALQVADPVSVRIRKGIDKNFIPVPAVVFRNIFRQQSRRPGAAARKHRKQQAGCQQQGQNSLHGKEFLS